MLEESSQANSPPSRSAILDAAAGLFIQQGYHGTSMRQIALQVHLAPASLYNHFSSKQALFEAVFQQNHPSRVVVPALLQAQGATPQEILIDALEHILPLVAARQDFFRLLMIDLLEFNGRNTFQIVEKMSPVALRLEQVILGGMQARPLPVAVLIRSFVGLIISCYLTEAALGEFSRAESLKDSLRYFVEIYLYGILEDKPDEAV